MSDQGTGKEEKERIRTRLEIRTALEYAGPVVAIFLAILLNHLLT